MSPACSRSWVSAIVHRRWCLRTNVVWRRLGVKTLAFDSNQQASRNSLYSLASVGGTLLGFFLLMAAYGHFAAVWPVIDKGMSASDNNPLVLLSPGLILATTGLINLGLCRALWMGVGWALQLALVFNGLAAMYLTYLLLGQSVPDHPIGIFVALVSSYIILLGAIRIGLVWPAIAE